MFRLINGTEWEGDCAVMMGGEFGALIGLDAVSTVVGGDGGRIGNGGRIGEEGSVVVGRSDVAGSSSGRVT